MSVQPEATEERPSTTFVDQGNVAFGDLMDALTEAEEGASARGADAADTPVGGDAANSADVATPTVQPTGEEPGGHAPSATAGNGTADSGSSATAGRAEGQGDGNAVAGADTRAAADSGTPDGSAEQPATSGGTAATPANWVADPAAVAPELGKLSAQLEANVTKAFQGEAFAAVKEEHGKYFEALQRHPRTMVGTEVPSVQGEGMETLRNTEDAKEWQEAVKSILTQEINARTETKVEESQQFLETVHASIDLFKTNKDLIPGTKGFNRGLADRFAAMAKPYEVRVDNKLQGYSIPVQPLIDQLRTQLAAQTPAAAPATSRAIPPEEPPQAGIASKAGEAGEPKEDFSALFNTIGSVNMQI